MEKSGAAETLLCVFLLQVFKKIPSLLYLFLQKNQLKEVPTALPVGLEQLRLSRNRISKIPTGAFKNLRHLALLDLYHNQVRGSLVTETPFAGVRRSL